MMEKKTWHFDFVIKKLTHKQARLLLDLINLYIAAFEAQMAGGFHGFHPMSEEDGEEIEQVPQG
ncbi:MAG: hypothetical protein ACYS30_24900 [Planctomycetota bacterium]|jgi:hypothetical protein